MLSRALSGPASSKEALLPPLADATFCASITRIAKGEFLSKSVDEIKGSGYCVESLAAALSCFLQTDSFEAAVLKATNLGDDADTTAAITTQRK